MPGRLIKSKSNSTATSEDSAQKLGNNPWREYELIATKVCSKKRRKWNARVESHIETRIDRTSFDFRFKPFWAIYCVIDQPSAILSQRSVLNFKFSVLTFLRSMSSLAVSCLMNIEQKLCKEKIFQLKSMPNTIRCIDKRFEVKNSGISCLALIFNLSNPRMTILHPKKWFQVAKYDESLPFFFHRPIQPYGSVVKASCGE